MGLGDAFFVLELGVVDLQLVTQVSLGVFDIWDDPHHQQAPRGSTSLCLEDSEVAFPSFLLIFSFLRTLFA